MVPNRSFKEEDEEGEEDQEEEGIKSVACVVVFH